MQAFDQRPDAGFPKHFVVLYVLAWATYVVAYGAVLRAAGMPPLRWAAIGAVANGLPPAVLGWWAIRMGRVAPRIARRGRFWACHLAAAALYISCCVVGTWLLFRFFHRLETGVWDWSIGRLGVLTWQLLIGTLLYTVLAGLGHAVALQVRLHEEANRAIRARELAARAQLEALRARLDPHFLFNTLHSLLALVRRDPEMAEEGLERLGDLLHYALRARGVEGDQVTLAEERAFLEGYIELERLRLADRLRWEERIATEALTCRLPAFTLQPLVENALRHAVASRAGGGRVTVGGQILDGVLVLEVADDGPGAEADSDAGGGLGLTLVRERLQALYGDRAGLAIETGSGRGFTARVHLPAIQWNEVSAP